MSFRLLDRFEATFNGRPYYHRNSQLGNRIADYLFDDLYFLDPDSRFVQDVNANKAVLNPKGVSPGLRARRGDGSFGPIVPGRFPRPFEGHAVPVGPTAEVDIGVEVKILAKAMIKQIDRVISDLCGQARHFSATSAGAITVGIVGLNLSPSYTSYESDRAYPTGTYGPHPAAEAPEAERRLRESAEQCFTEFLVLPFIATNVAPYPFRWANAEQTRDAYAAALARLSRRYARQRQSG